MLTPDAQRLDNIIRRYRVQSTVTMTDDGSVIVAARTVEQLTAALRDIRSADSDVNYAANTLNPGRRTRVTDDVTVTAREVPRLTSALDRAYWRADREAKIDRGQIPGALSGPEAVKVAKRMRGIR
ncbi:hypothetical protein [Leifsonia sp. Leaf264]|uniref:hypothetical protein n=1 Tax=Leifsonia sp. Leaf264 TaxID=1736314 RepID=UPI00070194A1|nr:hypothetical protein [Leifsonia sp. Leaf264]KQO98140.1 hypothetical protein ASF30_08760 [Leifsonia sp. Leaf264]